MAERPPPSLALIGAVLFDLDGTLTRPLIDFAALRTRLGVQEGVSILDALRRFPPALREAKEQILRQTELEAARRATPNRGAVELVHWLHDHGYATAVITRNFREAVEITLARLGLTIDVVVTRDCAPPKPAPDAVYEALGQLGRAPATALMVGDFRDDIEAGRRAGVMTCFLANTREGEPPEADLQVRDLLELLGFFRQMKTPGA